MQIDEKGPKRNTRDHRNDNRRWLYHFREILGHFVNNEAEDWGKFPASLSIYYTVYLEIFKNVLSEFRFHEF